MRLNIRASDLSIVSSWQLPADQQVKDGDFGSTPTLFSARIGGKVHHLVGIANKNGVYYALDEANIGNGPVWSAIVARGGSNAQAGFGSISPSAWDGKNLYVGGGKTTIGGNTCPGGLRALDPVTGAFLWERCMVDGPVLGAVTAVQGVVAVGEGNSLWLMAASDGHDLFKATDTNNGSAYYAASSISNGVLYIGNADGNFYVYGT